MAVIGKPKNARMSLIDEDVEVLVKNNPIYRGYAEAKTMTAAMRKKKLREEERIKATYDLPPMTTKFIKKIAKDESITQSQIANCLLVYAINNYLQGNVHFEKEVLKHSPRYDYKIVPPMIKTLKEDV